MKLPSAISTWCMILFFVFTALSAFGILFNSFIAGIFALGAAIFLLIGR